METMLRRAHTLVYSLINLIPSVYLPIDQRLTEKQVEPRCGIAIVDLHNGDVVHSLRM